MRGLSEGPACSALIRAAACRFPRVGKVIALVVSGCGRRRVGSGGRAFVSGVFIYLGEPGVVRVVGLLCVACRVRSGTS